MVEMEWAMAGAIQLPEQRDEGASELGEGRPVGHGGRTTAANTAVAEDEGHSAEAVVSPFKVSVLSVEFVASPARPLVVC